MDDKENVQIDTSHTSGSFRATKIWYQILKALQENVPRIPHKPYLSYNSSKKEAAMRSGDFEHLKTEAQIEDNVESIVFTGLSAVTALENFLTANRENLGMREVTRAKVFKLCEILLRDGYIEQVDGVLGQRNLEKFKSNAEFLADDQTAYRLSNNYFGSVNNAELEKGLHRFPMHLLSTPNARRPDQSSDCCPMLFETDRSVSSPLGKMPRKAVSPVLRPKSSSSKISPRPVSSASLAESEMDCSDCFTLTTDSKCKAHSVESLSVNSDSTFTEYEDFEKTLGCSDYKVVYDLALFRLLTLIEIPLLDAILRYKERGSSGGSGTAFDAFLSNFKFGRVRKHTTGLASFQNEWRRIKADCERLGDPWITSACLCIKAMASVDCQSLATIRLSPAADDKRCLFYHALEFIRRSALPLLPVSFDDILRSMHDQLLAGKRPNHMLEACQLLALLLPADKRRRLRALLTFLKICIESDAVRLNQHAPNASTVVFLCKDFIIKRDSLPKPIIEDLVKYLIDFSDSIFKLPIDFQLEFFSRRRRQVYTVAEPNPSIAFCSRISSDQFEIQKRAVSENCLIELAQQVVVDQSMNGKQKVAFLNKFERQYPHLYARVKW